MTLSDSVRIIDNKIDEFAKDIIQNGFINSYPLVHTIPKGKKKSYIVIDGNHRVYAMQQLKKQLPSRFGNFKIKCIVSDALTDVNMNIVGQG